jgi:hypothetical protein
MDLFPLAEKRTPDYPTLEKHFLNRRTYLKRITALAAMAALGGVTISASCSGKKPEQSGDNSLPRNTTRPEGVKRPPQLPDTVHLKKP